MATSDVKTIRQCLMVAEFRSVSRAAVSLNMAQPWLSTRVRAYEAELGFELFDRSRRQLALTPQGEVWVAQARRFVEAAETYGRAVRAIAAPTEMELRIGCPVSSSGLAERDELIRAYRARHPHAAVRIQLLPVAQLVEAQRRGSLDVVMMLDPLPRDFGSIERTLLVRQHAVVFMPHSWKPDGAAQLALGDLAGREIAVFPQADNPGLGGPVYAALREAGARLVEMSDNNFIALHHYAITHRIGALTVDSMAETLASVTDYGCYPLPGSIFDARLWLLHPPENAAREAKSFWELAVARDAAA